MRIYIVLVALLSLASCQTVFVWTVRDVIFLVLLGALLLYVAGLALTYYIKSTIKRLKKNKKLKRKNKK